MWYTKSQITEKEKQGDDKRKRKGPVASKQYTAVEPHSMSFEYLKNLSKSFAHLNATRYRAAVIARAMCHTIFNPASALSSAFNYNTKNPNEEEYEKKMKKLRADLPSSRYADKLWDFEHKHVDSHPAPLSHLNVSLETELIKKKRENGFKAFYWCSKKGDHSKLNKNRKGRDGVKN
jgi:hypothetical protein